MGDDAIAAAPATACRKIDGSVDLSVGDVECAGDLIVAGHVLDDRRVSAEGSVHVMGVIQAAVVQIGGELRADGGISGRQKARCVAGGGVIARYIVNASVQAAGNVCAQSEILGSEVFAGGDVIVEEGAIVGGRVSAMGNVRCRRLGSQGARTVVEAGVDSAVERSAESAIAKADAARKQAARIRQVVAPLLRDQKMLTSQQKEKATELLFEAEELEAGAERALCDLRARCLSQSPNPQPQIHIIERAGPGLTIRLADWETTLDTSIKGPASFVLKGTGADRRIVVVDGDRGVLELVTRLVASNGANIIRRLRATLPVVNAA